ncbi:MAG: hypothetical protein CL946_09265 [Ectothiorhodospiraceae bacterium]|nr:hypothetical protein [Ectothiorhodospiraceae bacterium]
MSTARSRYPELRALQIPDAEFAVCDVETTGLSADANRLTEIAVFRVANGEIVGSYSSLINPRQFISYEIQRLTGITNEMVYDAPELEDVMREVRDFMDGAVFVAHNAQFDRRFVDASLERCGLEPLETPTLCTARLARRLYPKQKRVSLGKIAAALGIHITKRHRAAGDAEATARMLIQFLRTLQDEFHMIEVDDILSFQHKSVYRISSPPKNIAGLKDTLDNLPHSSGVYFFYDRRGTILYIGKAKNLRKRVGSYFYHNAAHPEKIRRLVRSVRSITWENTETELSALLLESRSIKKHQPRFNSMLKRYRKYPFIRIDTADEFPRIGWTYEIEHDGAEYFGPFSSRFAVEDALDSINKLFHLRECEDALKPREDATPCMYYEIKRCSAPCALLSTKEEYLSEVEAVRLFLHGEHKEMMDVFIARMQRKSDALEFEEAALLRDRIEALERIIRQQRIMARSVLKQNLVIVTLARGTNVEVHLIKGGMLARQFLVDQKHINAKELRLSLEEIFYMEQAELFGGQQEDINEMRIIAAWCFSRRQDTIVVKADEHDSLDNLHQIVLEQVRLAGKDMSIAIDAREEARG